MYDLIVIGGGPGGAKAAELAARHGMKVVLIEKSLLGGTCLNRGCIPTKALYSHVIGGKGPSEGLWRRMEETVETLRKGNGQLMKMAGVEVLHGTAVVTEWEGLKKVTVRDRDGGAMEIQGKKILVAVGGRSVRPQFKGNDLPRVLTGDWAITDPELFDPERNEEVQTVAVLGAGVIALEMAMILQGLGKKVILLKHSDQILRRLDGDIKKKVALNLKRRKTAVRDYVRLAEAAADGGGLILRGTSGGEAFEEKCDRLILASSMVPVLDGYGLENGTVKVEKGCIVVDKKMAASVDGVWAVGDCTGGAMLAHLAEYQAISAVMAMTGGEYLVNLDALPACVFIDPEVGTVGLTEEQAKDRDLDYVASRAYFAANGMALAMGEKDGFVKVIARKGDGVILGVHIMGPEAASLLGEASLAVSQGLTVRDLAYTIHSHPTLCECLKDACMRIAEA